MSASDTAPILDIRSAKKISLVLTIAGLIISLVTLFIEREEFWRSYHWAWIYWLQIPLGCFAFLLLYKLVGGKWGLFIEPILKLGTGLLWPLGILFIPILFAAPRIFPWAVPGAAEHDHLLEHKAPYLNLPFFIVRSLVYWAVWLAYSRLFMRKVYGPNAKGPSHLRYLSSFGIVGYVLTMTFAAIDWGMSLEPHFYSTMYGLIFVVNQVLTAIAFVILVSAIFRPFRPELKGVYNDLGNLLYTFTMLWAYLAFMQYLIIWSGNLPEEVAWYIHRTGRGWVGFALALMFLGFFVPFLALLSRPVKRNPRTLAAMALLILFSRVLDIFWTVMPAFRPQGFSLHFSDLAAFLTIGGLSLYLFARSFEQESLPPALPEEKAATP